MFSLPPPLASPYSAIHSLKKVYLNNFRKLTLISTKIWIADSTIQAWSLRWRETGLELKRISSILLGCCKACWRYSFCWTLTTSFLATASVSYSMSSTGLPDEFLRASFLPFRFFPIRNPVIFIELSGN